MMEIAAFVVFAAATSVAVAPRDKFPAGFERRLLAQYADCVVKRRPKVVARFALERSFDQKLTEKVRISDCVPRGHGAIAMRMQRPLLHFALADALVRRDQSLWLGDLRTVPPLDHGTVEQEVRGIAGRWNKAQNEQQLADQQARAAATIGLFRFGECVLRAAPSEATELLRSEVATDSERAAFRKLQAAFENCLEMGATVTFSHEAARGTLALNYLRLARAPRLPSPATGQAQ